MNFDCNNGSVMLRMLKLARFELRTILLNANNIALMAQQSAFDFINGNIPTMGGMVPLFFRHPLFLQWLLEAM